MLFNSEIPERCIDIDEDGFYYPGKDCNDNDKNVSPNATEVCNNGKDDNCNGQVDEGCNPKPQEPDYVKQAKDARDEAVKQEGLAIEAEAAGNCDAAKAAATAAKAAEGNAAAARKASNFSRASSDFYLTALNASSKAASAAERCYLKQTKNQFEKAETQRDEALKQKELAIKAANDNNCTAAAAAAKAAATASAAAKAAANAANAAFVASDDAQAMGSGNSTPAAIGLIAQRVATLITEAETAATAAETAAKGCKPKNPPPPPPAPGRLTTTPTIGGGIGAAQPSASTGFCLQKDGLGKAPENSTIAPSVNVGMQISKNIPGGGISSLERPRSPYASFASYRPSAKGNAGPAPVTTAQGGQLNLMSLNLGVSYLHLEGRDRHPERNASFDKKMVEVLATGDFYFVNLLRAKRATKAPKVSPFVRLGAGFGIGDPNTVNGEQDTKKANFALPMGLGFRVNVSSLVSLNFDYTTRATFGDGLDGVASSTGGKDWYGAGGMGLNFMLGKKANDSDGDGVKNNDDPCPTVAGTLGGCPDTDGDGLGDKEDTCPNEAGDQRFNGCPDTDGDGVANNLDDCPYEAGLRRFSGCPDTDGDNIIDKEDKCPTVPGLAAINGCPDADRDGVTDDKDDCPDAPGPAEQNGCPDTDNDGIADNKDECPEAYGLAKFKGCPDTDNDGLADPQDKCPNLKGPASNEGCPEIDAEDKAVLDKAMRNVKFRTGSAELLSSSKSYLDQIAEVMSRYKGFKLSIDGYTDNEGPAASNQSLSEARARACYDYLSGIGVRLSQMVYAGHGPTNPIGDNNTKEGRLLNRRVEFTLIPQ